MQDQPRIPIDRGEPLSPTQGGRLCPTCGRPTAGCECRAASARKAAASRQPAGQPGRPADGIVRVSRETAGRKGKGVSLVSGLRLAPAQLEALCRELKQRCGAGGTVKAGVIEIQGDHRELLVAELAARGFTVKLAGG